MAQTGSLAYVLNGVILNIFVVLGLVGNILAMIVLRSPQLRSTSMNMLLNGKFISVTIDF